MKPQLYECWCQTLVRVGEPCPHCYQGRAREQWLRDYLERRKEEKAA